MIEQLQFQKFLLLGRVCEIHAVADTKRRKSKAQVAVEEAGRLIAEAEGESAELNEGKVVEPGKPVTDGRDFIKKKLLAHLDTITDGMFKGAKEMKPATLKLLWDLGKMDEKFEPKSEGDEMTLSKLLLNELRQKSKMAGEAQEQA